MMETEATVWHSAIEFVVAVESVANEHRQKVFRAVRNRGASASDGLHGGPILTNRTVSPNFPAQSKVSLSVSETQAQCYELF